MPYAFNDDKSKLVFGTVQARSQVGLMSYPVGSVYISYESTSPASLFGGTWKQLTNCFPRFANDTKTGGADTATLTTSQIPSHSHNLQDGPQGHYAGWGNSGDDKLLYGSVASGRHIFEFYKQQTTSTGSGKSHNNMPAYQNLYAWRRTE